MIILTTIVILFLIVIYSIFAGVIFVKANKGQKIYTLEYGFMLEYYVVQSNNHFQLLGIGKFSRILVSEYAAKYFEKNSLNALILHEKGHQVERYTIARMLYVIVLFLLIYPATASLVGWWQPLVIYVIYEAGKVIKNLMFTQHQHNNEVSADLFASKVCKTYGILDDFIKALMEISYLRESESHPNINKRIEKINEGLKDWKLKL
jgi:Zn-dependent protease with chaperone function